MAQLPLQNFIQNQTVVNANWLNQVDLLSHVLAADSTGHLSLAAPTTAGSSLNLANILGSSLLTATFTDTGGGPPAFNISSSFNGDMIGYQVQNTFASNTGGTFGLIVGNDTSSTFVFGKQGSGSTGKFSNGGTGDLAFILSGGTTPIAIGAAVFGGPIQMLVKTTGITAFVPTSSNGVAPPAQSTGWGTPTSPAVQNNYSGSAATLPQTSAAVAQIITYLKLKGDFGA